MYMTLLPWALQGAVELFMCSFPYALTWLRKHGWQLAMWPETIPPMWTLYTTRKAGAKDTHTQVAYINKYMQLYIVYVYKFIIMYAGKVHVYILFIAF